jgi:hypothetical protein
MTDPTFFDALERQLVAATADRTRRLRRARARRLATLSTILVAVLAAGGGLAAALTTSDHTNKTPARTTTTVNGDRLVPALPEPGTFTTAVLNATTIPGLARGVATRLANTRHKVGTVTNAATQDRATTRVLYVPGCRSAAEEVARRIDVATNAIEPADTDSRMLAGRKAQVIVVVGADQNAPVRTQ